MSSSRLRAFASSWPLALFAVVSALASSGCKAKAKLDAPKIGYRHERKGGLLEGKNGVVRNVRYLGCDVRFENLPEGTEIRIEWRFHSDTEKDWKTTQRETVKGTGFGTLRADLTSDAPYIDPGTWECDFHAFVPNGTATGDVDVSSKIDVKYEPAEGDEG